MKYATHRSVFLLIRNIPATYLSYDIDYFTDVTGIFSRPYAILLQLRRSLTVPDVGSVLIHRRTIWSIVGVPPADRSVTHNSSGNIAVSMYNKYKMIFRFTYQLNYCSFSLIYCRL